MNTQIIANRYRVDQTLAHINHSDFYEGRDLQTDSPVIVRFIHLDEPGEETKLQNFVTNEMRVLAQLHHPNILQTLDHGIEASLYWMIHEYVPFRTLRQMIDADGQLDLETALHYGLELADVLSRLHHIGIIHCDVKPDNVLVINTSIKLMEFSIANHMRYDKHVTGTPPYMSPESAMGASPAVPRDIWALGIVLFELGTGDLPFKALTDRPYPEAVPLLFQQIMRDPVPDIAQRAPNLPPRLISLIYWMLEKAPEKRIGSMRQVSAELEAILVSLRQGSHAPISGDVIQQRYRLQTMIAEGAFAQVFRAADLTDGRIVAVKRLKAGFATNPVQIARFRRESEILQQLNHPGIVRVRDSIDAGDDHYIIMDYVTGGDLRAYLNKQPLSVRTAVSIALDLADALTRAHHLNIIHRDIKPENVLMMADGHPQLSDFGLAHVDNATYLTETGALMGTLQYTAPEMLQGSPATKASDIWALGVMLYEMLTERSPFGRGTASQVIFAILQSPIPDLPDAAMPAPLQALVKSMLQRDPGKRIGTMREVAAQLERSTSELQP